jgi:hypothetical protein
MKSALLMLAAKPEDAEDVQAIFKKANRTKDLILFGADTPMRTNFFGNIKRPRDVVTFISTLSESQERGGKGGEGSQFYDQQRDRTIYNAVAALQAAKEPLTAANIHKFLTGAATSQEEMRKPEWRAKFHSQILERGFEAKKTPLEEHDYGLCLDFWLSEWPVLMDFRTRGNILATVQGTLHTMNTAIFRQMCCSEQPNCSPDDILNGKSILVNFAPSAWGAAGTLISAGWKLLMQLAILERKATEESPFVVIWCDEAPLFVSNYDSPFIAQCRSHKGCLVYLTQSVSSFYAAMKGESGHHQADALLANFTTAIVHACDAVTAKWGCSRLGRKKEILFGGNTSQGESAWDDLYGNSRFSGSFSERWGDVLQPQEFMVGRCGGPANALLCDAVVLKSGEPFSDGKNYLKTTFSQRG